ncbi:hypothetical protein JOF53_000302 [Crossiella equi]|uniref:Methyltransferase n=1 Tax=Crossiella equi TaxID=130796 RepID=A0ABS5A6T7_9PSEU|nr:methyltransferase [Crossiella equi]MBP2471430.1 hypothetical protein [Crossiella equi]
MPDDIAKLHDLAGLATPMTIRVAVTLGLPDRLRDTPATTAVLATELRADPTALELLLGHLATLGVLSRIEDGWQTTGFGALLGTDQDNGLANLLNLAHAGGRAELAFVDLLHSVTTGKPAYALRYGKDFWTDLGEHPRLRETFDRQMTDRLRAQVPTIVKAVDWTRFGTLVDVGGGPGSLLAAVLTEHPGLRGHLLDLPPTAATARRTFAEAGVSDRVEVTGGSFFDPLPAGADAYLLVDVLHNWGDEQAHQILHRCVEAARPDSRLLVIEPVGGVLAGTQFDLAMLVMFGGRERGLEEFRALAGPHGLVLDSVVELTRQRCLLEFRSE